MFHSVCPEGSLARGASLFRLGEALGPGAVMSDVLDLAGKVVIVTGGGRGVGRGIATRFLASGAEVVICGRKEPESLPEAGGRRARFVAADVRDVEQLDRIIAAAIDGFGRLDVLINNAGGSPPADAATVSPRFSASIVQLNL